MSDGEKRGLYIAIMLLAVLASAGMSAALVLWLQRQSEPIPVAASVDSEPEPVAIAIAGDHAPAPVVPKGVAAAAVLPEGDDEPARATREDVIAKSLPAVVSVDGKASAFFVAHDRALTNAHVVRGSSRIALKAADGTAASAIVLKTDETYDIAVLQVLDAKQDQPFLALGSALDMRAGQEVIAIGSPYGLSNSVSRGVISALRHKGSVVVIQTDAAINPGNSGGPLLDASGRVVGINSFGALFAQNLGFAVAAEHARAIVEGRSPMLEGLVLGGELDPGPRAPTSVAQAERTRQDAEAQLARRLEQMAHEARNLDVAVNRYLANFFSGRIEGALERPLFALLTDGAFQGIFADGSEGQLEELRRFAIKLRDAVNEADENARRADVAPGQRRALRERHGFAPRFWDP
jgi:hypothetical protein